MRRATRRASTHSRAAVSAGRVPSTETVAASHPGAVKAGNTVKGLICSRECTQQENATRAKERSS